MVNPRNQKPKKLNKSGFQKNVTTVTLSEVLEAGTRLEASGFNVKARIAKEKLFNSNLKLRPLFGTSGLASECHNAFRFRRIFVQSQYGLPFLSSAEIIALNPRIDRYLSKKLSKDLKHLTIKHWDVLISRSGTIGNVALAGRTFAGKALSEHVIRVRFEDIDIAAFVAAFLRSTFGRLQLQSVTYGSVVVHIEPEHLFRVLIPIPHPVKRIKIGRLFSEACEARDEANDLLERADKLLHKRLKLPPLDQVSKQKKQIKINVIKAHSLKGRFEASFHDWLAGKAERTLISQSQGATRLDDPSIVKEIRPITKFRKRVYVAQNGIPLLSSKQLFQIDPIDVKQLGKGRHLKDLVEIGLEENMIAVTCSGTIGRVQLIPQYMEGWAANQHAIRIISTNKENAGFLYAWLASDYGHKLITRHSYGSVILEIDRSMLASIPVPKVRAKDKREVAELVLQANVLRNTAWEKEQEALRRIEHLVEG